MDKDGQPRRIPLVVLVARRLLALPGPAVITACFERNLVQAMRRVVSSAQGARPGASASSSSASRQTATQEQHFRWQD